MKKKNQNILTIILSILRTLTVMGLLIWLTTIVANRNVGTTALSTGQKTLIICSFILAIICFVLVSLQTVLEYCYNEQNYSMKIFILALIALNIEVIIFSLRVVLKNKAGWNFNFKPQKWNIFDISIMSLLLGTYLLIEFVTSFIPPLPFWITPSFKYVVILFAAYILTFSQTFTICLLLSIITIVMPGTAVMSPIQYIFDYVFVIWAFSLACFFRPNIKINNHLLNILQWNVYVFVPIIIVYCSRVISGVAFWLNPDAYDGVTYEFNWDGALGYSLIYNSFNTIVDYAVLLVLVPTVCIPLSFLRDKQKFWHDKVQAN